jgi:two-component system, OmpR family, sensor histidine kinase KdpD
MGAIRRLAPAAWLLLAMAATAGFRLSRGTLDKAHMALAFLLIVLGASAVHGRRVGFALAGVCFLLFNYFLLPPYHTLGIADPLDWGVLAAFLITGAVAAQLLHRAQREARLATARAREIDRLSVLGAETLNAGRAADAMPLVARVIRSTLRLAQCEIWMKDDGDGFRCSARDEAGRPTRTAPDHAALGTVLETGCIAVEDARGTTTSTPCPLDDLAEALRQHPGRPGLLLPLRVRGRGLGVLRLRDVSALALDAAAVRFTQALAYYAALGVERILLEAESDRVHALREADRLREALVAGVSHDLRTPLTTIKALASELRQDGDARAAVIEEEADRLNDLVADLLDLSRIRAGALPTSVGIVAGEDVLGSALQRVEGRASGRPIIASLPPDGSVPAARMDFSHSVRALVNLLENALKYSPPDAPVEVTLAREGPRLLFTVLDRGPGVDPAEADRIFEPFYRPEASPPDAARYGLGLAIARQLAEIQGGTVEYTPRPGGGSCFRLALPAEDDAFAS